MVGSHRVKLLRRGVGLLLRGVGQDLEHGDDQLASNGDGSDDLDKDARLLLEPLGPGPAFWAPTNMKIV